MFAYLCCCFRPQHSHNVSAHHTVSEPDQNVALTSPRHFAGAQGTVTKETGVRQRRISFLVEESPSQFTLPRVPNEEEINSLVNNQIISLKDVESLWHAVNKNQDIFAYLTDSEYLKYIKNNCLTLKDINDLWSYACSHDLSEQVDIEAVKSTFNQMLRQKVSSGNATALSRPATLKPVKSCLIPPSDLPDIFAPVVITKKNKHTSREAVNHQEVHRTFMNYLTTNWPVFCDQYASSLEKDVESIMEIMEYQIDNLVSLLPADYNGILYLSQLRKLAYNSTLTTAELAELLDMLENNLPGLLVVGCPDIKDKIQSSYEPCKEKGKLLIDEVKALWLACGKKTSPFKILLSDADTDTIVELAGCAQNCQNQLAALKKRNPGAKIERFLLTLSSQDLQNIKINNQYLSVLFERWIKRQPGAKIKHYSSTRTVRAQKTRTGSFLTTSDNLQQSSSADSLANQHERHQYQSEPDSHPRRPIGGNFRTSRELTRGRDLRRVARYHANSDHQLSTDSFTKQHERHQYQREPNYCFPFTSGSFRTSRELTGGRDLRRVARYHANSDHQLSTDSFTKQHERHQYQREPNYCFPFAGGSFRTSRELTGGQGLQRVVRYYTNSDQQLYATNSQQSLDSQLSIPSGYKNISQV